MSSVDSEWLERSDHPLLNNLILDSIFQHLGKKELKACRLVCKTWSVLTIPYTRKAFHESLVTINGNYPWKLQATTIQNFVEVFRSNKYGIPFTFTRFELGSFCMTEGDGQEFFQLCGDTAKEIRFVRELCMVEDVAELLKSTPTLEILHIPSFIHSRSGNAVKLFPDGLENSKSRLTSLKMLIGARDGGNCNGQNEYCPTFLEELITAAQNISCLDMREPSGSTIFEVLSLIEKLGRESSIQELGILVVECDDYDYADLLVRMTLKPNGLRLKKFHYDSTLDTLALQLLPHFKDTLECLHLDLYETECTSFTEFPKMSLLTTMSLAWFPDFQFRGVNLNEMFPVLSELKLRHVSDQENNEFFQDSAPCPNMNTFQLNNDFGLTINGFNQMLRVFPNLTRLSIDINSDGAEILRQIWSRMTQLKSFNICGRIKWIDSLDSVLTGISTHELEEMRDVVKNLEKTMTAVERREMILCLRNQHSTLPSITNLTNMSSLTMKLTGDDPNPSQKKYLNDLSGYLAFYSMNRLKELRLEECKLTKTCCEILKKDMGLESWTFRTLGYKNIIPPVKNN